MGKRYKSHSQCADEKPFQVPADKNVIVVYPGRFQPFHLNHYSVYRHLVELFGARSVYIASSGKTDPDTAPLSFEERKLIMTQGFEIPADRIVEVASPYAPKEILSQYNKETDAYLAVLSEKDEDRLYKSPYFLPYNNRIKELLPYGKKGYYYIAPEFKASIAGEVISGTVVRKYLRENVSLHARAGAFTRMYGKWDRAVFALLNRVFTVDTTSTTSLNEAYISELEVVGNEVINPHR